jgi:beta-glucuronidase
MKNKFLLIALLSSVACSTLSAQVPLLQTISGRKTMSLDGQWQSQVDVYGVASQDRSGLVKDRKPVKYEFKGDNLRNSELVEQNMDVSEQLQVPGDWNTQRENLFFYEGNMW